MANTFLLPRICICGTQFYYSHKAQIHCSRRCRSRSQNRPACQECGINFRGRPTQKFCSTSCSNIYLSRVLQIPNKCESCGHTEARRDGHKQEFCKKCRDKRRDETRVERKAERLARRKLLRKRREAQLYKVCAWCGIKFKATTVKQRFCCEHCNNIAKKKRRQTRLRSGPNVQSPSLGEIYRRDRAICQLCKTRVGRSYKWPHARSPSLDHIVPVSEGGHDETRNIQLAHLGCNIKKQKRKCGSQLRLI